MTENKTSSLKALWVLPPIIIGLAFFMLMKSGKQAPALSETSEAVHSVRIMNIEETDFIPIARGYGEVTPAQTWKSIAQVSGRIISTHPRLQDGEIIQQGEQLLKIDPVDYELNLAQAETRLAELEVQQSNTKSSLNIEQKNLALAQKEYERLQQLTKKGSVSQSSADAAERNMLTSSAQVQNLKNSLSLLPSQKKLQQAKITQAQRDLANTEIRAPFNLRVSGLAVESDQFVSVGQVMFSGDAVERVEIVAQVALFNLKNLFTGMTEAPTDLQTVTSSKLNEFTGFKPTVRLDMGNEEFASWEARFVRFSDRVDSHTRTLGVVVAVDNPLKKIIPGIRPPLSKGMFVEVVIAGHTQKDSIVIPRSALRNGKVYVMNNDNRLEIREVRKLYDQQAHSIIKSGLSTGEKLVLSDLVPAVEGMLLNAVVDNGK